MYRRFAKTPSQCLTICKDVGYIIYIYLSMYTYIYIYIRSWRFSPRARHVGFHPNFPPPIHPLIDGSTGRMCRGAGGGAAEDGALLGASAREGRKRLRFFRGFSGVLLRSYSGVAGFYSSFPGFSWVLLRSYSGFAGVLLGFFLVVRMGLRKWGEAGFGGVFFFSTWSVSFFVRLDLAKGWCSFCFPLNTTKQVVPTPTAPFCRSRPHLDTNRLRLKRLLWVPLGATEAGGNHFDRLLTGAV